jgi:hypothetical protein
LSTLAHPPKAASSASADAFRFIGFPSRSAGRLPRWPKVADHWPFTALVFVQFADRTCVKSRIARTCGIGGITHISRFAATAKQIRSSIWLPAALN